MIRYIFLSANLLLAAQGFAADTGKVSDLEIKSGSLLAATDSNSGGRPFVDLFSIKKGAIVNWTMEVDAKETCVDRSGYLFSSPFTEATYNKAFAALSGLENKNITIRARLSYEYAYGYSKEARYNYFKLASVDPLSLIFHVVGKKTKDRWKDWGNWKIRYVNDHFIQGIKSLRDSGKEVTLLVDPAWLLADEHERFNAVEDWPSWVKSGVVDEIVLESQWENPENSKLIGLAREAVKGSKVKVSIALDMRRNGAPIDPLVQLLNLQGQKVDRVVVNVEDEADKARAKTFVTDVLADFQFAIE